MHVSSPVIMMHCGGWHRLLSLKEINKERKRQEQPDRQPNERY
jgi:hypothetical protein